jgi:nucleoside-diphosphate-sugar epimerase
MLQGLSKLIKASKQHKVKRLVHLSSVMVFGDPPVAPTEDSPIVEQSVATYGGVKLKQDKMVITAAKEGLNASILVPPNISGPYSDYLLGLLGTINSGEFALMDNGVAPSNLVDVQNLCQAIELAMTEGRNDASRYLITDDETTTWSDMIGDLQDLQVTETEMMSISRSELEQAVIEPPAPKGSIGLSMKHLVSSHIREALRKDPLWEKFDLTMRGLVASMGSKMENTLRLSIEGEALVNKRKEGLKFNARICGQQLREGRHSIARARSELGYSPEVSYRQSMDNFKTWYRCLHALDGKFADMLRQLYS